MLTLRKELWVAIVAALTAACSPPTTDQRADEEELGSQVVPQGALQKTPAAQDRVDLPTEEMTAVTVPDAISSLRKEFQGRLAGIYTTASSSSMIVVRLKGEDAPPRRVLKAAGQEIIIEFEAGAEHSVGELVAAYENKVPAIQALFPTLQGIGTDEKTGEIVVVVAAQGPAAEAALGKREDLLRLLKRPVRIEITANATME